MLLDLLNLLALSLLSEATHHPLVSEASQS